jgi:hypothetical protein
LGFPLLAASSSPLTAFSRIFPIYRCKLMFFAVIYPVARVPGQRVDAERKRKGTRAAGKGEGRIRTAVLGF